MLQKLIQNGCDVQPSMVTQLHTYSLICLHLMQMPVLVLMTVQTDTISMRYEETEKWQYSEIFASYLLT